MSGGIQLPPSRGFQPGADMDEGPLKTYQIPTSKCQARRNTRPAQFRSEDMPPGNKPVS